MKKPRIKIVRMSEKWESDQLMKNIVLQNNLANNKVSIELKHSWERNGYFSASAEVDSVTFKEIMALGKLNIGWDRCPVYEDIDLRQCYNCAGFNHKAKDCNNKTSCSRCAGNHNLTKCPSDQLSCINCLMTNKSLNLKLSTNHAASDKTCPVYLRKLGVLKSKIKYDSP